MKKIKLSIFAILIIISSLAFSCSENPGNIEDTNSPTITSTNSNTITPTTTPLPSSSPAETSSPEPELKYYGGISIGKDSILIRGTSTLADFSLLRTQLYANGKPVDWWPTEQDVLVHGGEWLIYVQLGKNGAPDSLLRDTSYTFKAWEKDNPSNIVGFLYFNLTGQTDTPITTN